MLGFFKKLSAGLSQSSGKISSGITEIFTKKKLDAETLAQLEELLISADLGPATAAKLAAAVAKNRFNKEISVDEIKEALAEEIEKILLPAEKTFITDTAKPFVMLMVGVNGTGKTTTIGKWAHQFKNSGRKVMLAAGDTLKSGVSAWIALSSSRKKAPMLRRWLLRRWIRPLPTMSTS
jgi:fused signal recognition particle receptor